VAPVLIVGCGYVGRRVAARKQAAGCRVTALVRTPASAAQFAARGPPSGQLVFGYPH
jgi:phosphoglycerate dehydrogenase-like enzyme